MPSITLSPVISYPGTTIKVTGSGFKKNQSVKLLIDPPKGAVKSYKCNTKGQFSGTIVTGLQSSIGVHQVNVTSGTSPAVLAQAVFYLMAKPSPPNIVTDVVAVPGNAKIRLTWGPQ